MSLVTLSKFGQLLHNLVQLHYNIVGPLAMRVDAVVWVIHGCKFMAAYMANSYIVNCDK